MILKSNKKPARIQPSDLFKNLTRDQYDAVMQSGVKKTLKPKSFLFHQGESAKNCYLIKRGHLKLTQLTEQGREVIIRYISAGELTAAIAVLNNREYPVTAESIEETEVVGWDRRTIMTVMKTIPDLAINALGIVLDHLEDIQNRYTELCTERVEQRIARTILRLSKASGVKTSEGIRIDIPLSRQNIADYTGTTMFTVSRVLSSWEKMGWIRSQREKITLIEAHALVTFAEKIE